MAFRVFYEAGIYSTSEEITDRVQLYTLDVAQNAEEGSVASSSILVEDPDGDYDVVGWRRVRIYEGLAASSNTLMYNGWVADREITRGTSALTAAARSWNVTMVDNNTVMDLRIENGTDANRPAETDVQRIQWLLTTTELNPVTVSEYVNASSPKQMDAVDYRGQRVRDVIDDCAQISGKNYFIYTKDATSFGGSLSLGLWYDFVESTAYSSPLRLTNLLADVDSTWTFAIAEDTSLTRDPSRVYSGAYVRYDGGTVYEENITTANVFTRRDAVYDASNVKSSTKATARALRYLTQSATEEDRIETAFWCPPDKVNFVREGMRIQFRATHLPQYESYQWLRVLSRKIKHVAETDRVGYLVSLTLTSGTLPESPAGTPTTLLSFAGHIGSAVFLGLPADREADYGSSHGQTATLTVGKQYRIVFTSTDCRVTDPSREYDQINGFNCRIFKPTATETQIVQSEGYNWTPDDGTMTASLQYAGIGWNVRSPIRSGGTAPNNMYGPGSIITGEWLTYDGPTTSVDLAMRGIALSGFYGFELLGTVELQER